VLRPYAEGATEPAFVPGLGLLTGLAIGVHFNLEDRLDLMRQTMLHTGTGSGLAIEEDACVMLRDGQPARVSGQSAYRVMRDDASPGSCVLVPLV
jgi:cyanophycinase-like exopeptidase